MLKKFLFILSLVCTALVMPSYTNTCAKPTAAFLKAVPENAEGAAAAIKPVFSERHGLEVFPLELLSMEL